MLPEGYKPSKKVVIASSVLLTVLLIYAVYINTKNYIAFSGEVRYTIGITTKRYLTSQGRDIDYSYRVNGRTYRDATTYAYESKVGHTYWVKYSVKYPEVSEIYQNLPVDPRIDTLPPNGFKKMYSYRTFLKWKERVRKQSVKR